MTIWKGMADWVANNLGKGDGIAVSGRLRWREWEDKEGQKRQAVDVIADSIVPRSGNGNGGGRRADSDIPVDSSDFRPVAASSAADDEIPF